MKFVETTIFTRRVTQLLDDESDSLDVVFLRNK